MAPATTTEDICSHCGSAWRPGWERCRRCGATARNRVPTPVAGTEASDASGLELDRRPRPRPRRAPEASVSRISRAEASEAPTRELAPETGPLADPTPRVAAAQLLSGMLALLLLLQMAAPAALPSLALLGVQAFRGERVGALRWLLASVPWALTAAVFALALTAAREAVGQRLVRSPVASALAAALPGVLLWGWPMLHGHLASALVRRGGRRRAEFLTGWSRAVLGCLSAEVLLTVLDGLGILSLPPVGLAAAMAVALAARLGHLCALSITLPGLLLRPSRAGAPLPSTLVCPQCGSDAPTLQRFRDGLAGSACVHCSGALLGPGQVSTLLSMAQVEDAAYRREIRLGATGTRPLHCPQCGSAMRGVQLRTVTAHGCPACGSLWVDRLGLARLTGGRAVLSANAARPSPAVGRFWPTLVAGAALLVAAAPWVAVHAGWCRAEAGACASVPASPTSD